MSDAASLEKELSQLKTENERLKVELRRTSNIINLSIHPIWQRDESLNIIYCNLAFTEACEHTAEDMLEISEMELFKGHRKLAEKALKTGEEQVVERHIIINGQRRLFTIREVPEGKHVVTGYAAEITELDDVREEVQRYISAQQDFLEVSTSAMAIYGKDMRLMHYNYSFARLWGLDEAFLDRQPDYGEILEALRERRALPEQANFAAFKQQQLKLFTDLIDPHEEFYYLPDGKILRVFAIPHALGGLMFAFEDVTDRLALERSYNTLIAVQTETLDNLNEAIVVVGEDGRIKLYNPTFLSLWNLESKQIDGDTHVRDLLDACRAYFILEDWDEFKDGFSSQLQQRNIQEGRIERSDQSVLDWRMVPLPDGGTLVTYTDVTDSTLVERSLREKNEALEEADKLKTEFLANVSYELRSPLTSISGFADILRNEYFGELTEKQSEYVEGIHQSCQHLGQLINNILDLASIEAGYMQLDLSEFDIYEMLEAVLLLLKERLKVLGLRIHNKCDPDIGNMRADETRVKQVMFNLLSNAAKYSKANSSIDIGADRQADGRVMMWVEDHGVGIEKDKQHLVFDKFYRAGAVSNQQSGSGLGLSIVKSFIELHGGQVLLDSEPNVGTKVMCYIPTMKRYEEKAS
ncbi:MAG: PAS-domain containing protein [Rickettsiales bacterium]|nr:PAS-domain containing protein [Rickettsiales bacterium]